MIFAYKILTYMFLQGYCEKSAQTDVSNKKIYSELLVTHELKPCFNCFMSENVNKFGLSVGSLLQ